MPPPRLARSRASVVALLRSGLATTLISTLVSCSERTDPPAAAPTVELDDPVGSLVADEERLLEFTPRLKVLSNGVRDLRLPSAEARALFTPMVTVNDIGDAPSAAGERHETAAVDERTWPIIDATRTLAIEDVDLWRALFDGVRWFDAAKFYIVRGRHESAVSYVADVGFKSRARTTAGDVRAAYGDLVTRWSFDASLPEDEAWRIESFVVRSFRVVDAPALLFDEVLDHAVPDATARALLRRSVHEEKVVEFYRDGKTSLPKKEYVDAFSPDATEQHPALSVADVDGDGFEDLYVMARWGKNRLLRSRGDGTFEEAAERFGLDLRGLSTGAALADFDNDGDVDAMLGRSLERSLYLVQDDGRFHDRTAEDVACPMPGLVTSVSAADVDQDGLLDVYLSTYGQAGRELKTREAARKFLTEEETEELWRRRDESVAINPYFAASGLPNLLLSNVGGGRFERSPHDEALDHWTQTFQAVFADIDDDGDPDLYIANDYAPDRLYRNDLVAGFVDITEPAGGDTMFGFGMGADFGDYDNDGRQDLYVSNMFSKAGRRITARIEGVDWRIARLAQGNLLFKNRDGGSFELVSGEEEGDMHVTMAGWSWGGQFGDFDNDGWLDIYVASGNYTAPKEIAYDVDL